MSQNPINDYQDSLALTLYFPLSGVFPSNGGSSNPGYTLGDVGIFAGNYDPVTALANGALLPIQQNTAVFSLLGTTYGGNGTSNFALPNLVGATMIGDGQGTGLSNQTEGAATGTASVTLTQSQTPSDLGGSSQPFDNIQPSLPIQYDIAVDGVFPSQGGGGSAELDTLGMVIPFAGNFVPSGFMAADGQLLSIQQNTALFSILGTTYGGNGTTTFALPDLRGRDVIGASSSDPLGTVTGGETVSLANSQIPATGQSEAPFDNQQPSLALNYIIATSGIFPSQAGSQNNATAFLGQIVAFAGNFAPSGWAFANGQLLSIQQNTALFSVLGTTYGGNGTTNFALPDLNDRTVIGAGNGFTVGEEVGANSPTISADELPPPAAPTGLALAVASDSGAVGDNITNVTTPTVTGSGFAGDTITLDENGIPTASGMVANDGTWSIATAPLTDGAYTLTATQTDVVGNVSTASAGLSVTIDTTLPAVAPASLTVAGNSGPAAIGITAPTDALAFTIAVTGLPTDGTVTLGDGVTPVTQGETLAVSDLTGLEFAPTAGLFDASSAFTYSVTDTAGNVADGSATLGIAQQTNPPESLTGDGQSDLLMTSNTSGALVLDELSGGTMGYTQIGALGQEWQFEGSGPFLGDGSEGELLWNANSGGLIVAEDNGGTAAYTTIGGVGSEWQFAGNGAFLGQSTSDFLLWSNVSGVLVVGAVSGGQAQYTAIGGVGSNWQFEGAGDYLGDGQSAFLMEDSTSGVLVAGEDVNGSAQYTAIGALGPEWVFEGSGDLLGHGQDDFLIRDSSSGVLVVGEVTGGAAQYTVIGAVGAEWDFLGVGNYDGTSNAEFMMEDANDGTLVLGSVKSGSASYATVGGVGASEWNFHTGNVAVIG